MAPFEWVPLKVPFAELEIPNVEPAPVGGDAPVVQPAVQTGLPYLVRDDSPVVVVVAPPVDVDSVLPLPSSSPDLIVPPAV